MGGDRRKPKDGGLPQWPGAQSPAMRRSRISHSILALLLASASLASPPAGAAHAKLGEPVIGFVICERIPVQSDGAWVLIGF